MGGTDSTSGDHRESELKGPILLFDGTCHLCHGAVKFLIRRDKNGQIRYAPLQSETGKRLISDYSKLSTVPDGVALFENGNITFESEAALRSLTYLNRAWRFLSVLRFIPSFIRQPVYRFIAKNRYKWFGQYDSCQLPEVGWKNRFID